MNMQNFKYKGIVEISFYIKCTIFYRYISKITKYIYIYFNTII